MRKHYAPATMVVLLLVAGVTLLPGGAGNVGKTTDKGSGGTITFTTNPSFSETVLAGTDVLVAVYNMAAAINADADLQAMVVTDPNDPTANSFEVLHQDGSELDRFNLSETDPNIDDLAITSDGSWLTAVFFKVTAVAGNGNYRLVIDVENGTDFDQTFLTTIPANDTPAELNASIASALRSAGFMVNELPDCMFITKKGDLVVGIRASSTDTGVVVTTLEVKGLPAVGTIPTLSQYGMFVLVLLMTGAAMIVMRRKAAASH
jgi:hypothetical protein